MSATNSLSGKVALVTGGSRGIGRAISLQLAAAGASVAVNYAGNQAAAGDTVRAVEAAGGKAAALQADVSRVDEIHRIFDDAIARFGRVDILVNNAGVALYRLVKDTTEEEFDRTFSVNVRGVFFALKEAATRLADGGRVINFSSTTTRVMLPTYGAYSASKAAVEQLTRVFAKEMGPRKITVNCVLPGPVNTELFNEGKTPEVIARLAAMSAFNRIGEPVDIARVVAFLASDDAGWITGQNLGINGGFA
ncbi:3-ketoacyl-ACP reductase [Verrucomicrobia bacterium SCGC AG-212-E04]|nr:3-ketoacyl-ACP reductase [Verrucomicrobia bacterium SCGC AG-212-E04]